MTPEQMREAGARLVAGALGAIDPARRVAETLSDLPELADWIPGIGRESVGAPERPRTSDRGGRTALLAVGKASAAMTRGALVVLGDRVDTGIVVVPPGGSASGLPDILEVIRSDHPLPGIGSEQAGRRVATLLDGLGSFDRLLVLLSGGGSAMVTLPAGDLTLADVREAHRILLTAGLPIQQVNDVRRVLDDLKGGGMAARASSVSVIGLVLSDIPGMDDRAALADVASGPLSASSVTCRDVEILLRREGLFDRMPKPVQDHLVARRRGRIDPSPDSGVPLHSIGGGRTALDGMRRAATEMGLAARVLREDLRGEARGVGRGLARAGLAVQDGVAGFEPPVCLLAAGETTVRVVGDGVGGPNQETALAAALLLAGRSGILVGSFGTDGVDGPTDAAGGWVDGRTVRRAAELGFSIPGSLDRNDAGTVLDALGDCIRTGPTGTNVADVMFVVIATHEE